MAQAPDRSVDALIVGAGMAGLCAAAELHRAGRRVLVLDKGRGVGGRLASRRIGDAVFDHGAQSFTAHGPRFAALVDGWRQAGVAEPWDRAEGPTRAHWRGRPAMTAVAKHLALGLDVALQAQVTSVRRAPDGWLAETSAGEVIAARSTVLTAPVPQSLTLLAAGDVTPDRDTRARFEGIHYARCLAVMAVLSAPSRIPPAGLAPVSGPVAWVADNQRKGVSPVPAVTIHASHDFSLEHWDRDRQASGRMLLDAADPWLGADVTAFHVHAWRYATPLRTDAGPCAIVSEHPRLVLAGDGFGGPHVEDAALSGWAAAESVLEEAW